MQLEYVILGVLCLGRVTGYDLRRWMEGPGRFLGYGDQLPQFYRTLGKMVGCGWVAFDVDPREGRPDAKVYRITEEGREALMAWARSPYAPWTQHMDPDFILRFVFAQPVRPRDRRRHRADRAGVPPEERERRRLARHSGRYDQQIPEVDPLRTGGPTPGSRTRLRLDRGPHRLAEAHAQPPGTGG